MCQITGTIITINVLLYDSIVYVKTPCCREKLQKQVNNITQQRIQKTRGKQINRQNQFQEMDVQKFNAKFKQNTNTK